jgi:hypothetical protein
VKRERGAIKDAASATPPKCETRFGEGSFFA